MIGIPDQIKAGLVIDFIYHPVHLGFGIVGFERSNKFRRPYRTNDITSNVGKNWKPFAKILIDCNRCLAIGKLRLVGAHNPTGIAELIIGGARFTIRSGTDAGHLLEPPHRTILEKGNLNGERTKSILFDMSGILDHIQVLLVADLVNIPGHADYAPVSGIAFGGGLVTTAIGLITANTGLVSAAIGLITANTGLVSAGK